MARRRCYNVFSDKRAVGFPPGQFIRGKGVSPKFEARRGAIARLAFFFKTNFVFLRVFVPSW